MCERWWVLLFLWCLINDLCGEEQVDKKVGRGQVVAQQSTAFNLGPPNMHFVGRDKLLGRLEAAVFDQHGGESTRKRDYHQSVVVVLSGMGGVGE